MDELQLFLNMVVQKVLPIALTALVGFLALKFTEFLAQARTQAGESQYKLAYEIVKTGVLFAEQSGLIGLIEKIGSEKKQFALEFILAQLEKNGLGKIDIKTVDAMIEAAVQELFNRFKETAKPVG